MKLWEAILTQVLDEALHLAGRTRERVNELHLGRLAYARETVTVLGLRVTDLVEL